MKTNKMKINLQLFTGGGNNVFDAMQPREIGIYWTEGQSNRTPYLGELLFPPKKQLGLDLSWIKGSKGLPIALKPSAFDSETRLRDRVGFDELQTEMPFFKEGTLIKEKDRQELNKVQSSGNQAYIDIIVGKIFDDVTSLVDGARVQSERMIMQLLSSGKIGIKANKLDYDYDYKMNEDNMEILLTTDRWSELTTSNPVEDIERWMDAVEDTVGSRPTKAICSKKTFNYIKNNSAVKLDMNPVGSNNIIVTNSMIEEYLEMKLGLKVVVYNKKFKSEAGVSTQFFPDDVFTLIPDGNLGNLYFGTTPEESDLIGGSDAAVEIVNTGVAITTVKKTDPVNVFTKVSAIMLPSFESIDGIFIGTVN